MRKWRIEDSAELYNINGWGLNYFSINEEGHVVVTPKENSVEVDLKYLVEELQLRDVSLPMLLRFTDILDSRIEKMASCFKIASEEYKYKAQNFIIYPIKVNQMRPVVEEIVGHGKKFNIGLEAGSKPELHAVIAINTDNDSLIVCNGYKDEDYIELALLAQKMGRRIFLVVEKLSELKLIIKIAKQFKIKPNLGIRIKLASSGSGKWEDSGGDVSKFGLTSSELLEALDIPGEEQDERLSATHSFSHRQPGKQYPQNKNCHSRSIAVLCPASFKRLQHWFCRYRRRAWRRLRRHQFIEQRKQCKLQHTGICQRCDFHPCGCQ